MHSEGIHHLLGATQTTLGLDTKDRECKSWYRILYTMQDLVEDYSHPRSRNLMKAQERLVMNE